MFLVARWLRQRPLRRNDFDLTAARRQSILEISRAVASTKGSSTGGVAGDGPMAVTGRAPMLPVDYSFSLPAANASGLSTRHAPPLVIDTSHPNSSGDKYFAMGFIL